MVPLTWETARLQEVVEEEIPAKVKDTMVGAIKKTIAGWTKPQLQNRIDALLDTILKHKDQNVVKVAKLEACVCAQTLLRRS